MKFSLYLSIFVLMLSTEAWSQTQNCTQNQNDPNNHIISQVVGSETITREYILYIPENYDESTSTPLVINMHGFGDCASNYAESIGQFYKFNELADEENFIVAYPQGAYRPEKEDTYWEPGDTGVDDIYESDIYFIEELISDIGSEYNLDADKIYACGYSNGGMMAYSLACNRSNVFSAIGIMSGIMLEEDCTVDNAVPVIKFHGIADFVLPYDGSIWYSSVAEVVNFWLDQNNISNSSLISSQMNGGNVTLDEYSGGDDNSCLDLYTIIEEFDKPGDHVWFSEDIEGLSPNRIMWNFFKNNCSEISSTDNYDIYQYEFYPNPVTDILTIDNAINQTYSVNDINGKLVLEGKIQSDAATVSLEHLQNGVYIIKIGNQVGRLLKI